MAQKREELISSGKAEVYHGDELCQEKTKFLLKEVGLPNGLLPLKDIIECGYVEETGYVWLKQKKKIEHNFASIGRLVSYATDITAYVEKCRIKKVTGVKAKELLLWVPLYEISVDDPSTGKLHCKSTAGVYKIFPTSAFEVPEVEPAAKDVKTEKTEKKESGADMAEKVAPLEPVKADLAVPAAPIEPVAQVAVNK